MRPRDGRGIKRLPSCRCTAFAEPLRTPTPTGTPVQRTWCLARSLWLMASNSCSCENLGENIAKPAAGAMSAEGYVSCRDLTELPVHRVSGAPKSTAQAIKARRTSKPLTCGEESAETSITVVTAKLGQRGQLRRRRYSSWRALSLLVLLAAVLRPVLACPAACTCTTLSTSSRVPGIKENRKAKGGVRMACVGAGLTAAPRPHLNHTLNPASVTR
ncbi:hypothetical protein OTU49_004790, partial [Cherax quadricarinatus]